MPKNGEPVGVRKCEIRLALALPTNVPPARQELLYRNAVETHFLYQSRSAGNILEIVGEHGKGELDCIRPPPPEREGTFYR